MSDRHTDSLSGEKAVEQLAVRYNELFGSLYEYNYRLMKESEDQENEGKYPFESIFDFYITSNAQSLCKSFLLNNRQSVGMFLNARCILEGMAIKRKFEKGEIPPNRIELLQKQVFLIEHKYYSRFDDIAEIILIPEKLEADYDQACEGYRKLLSQEFTDKDIKK